MATKRTSSRFPRSVRLLRHADFERVYREGRRHFSGLITVFYSPRPEQETRTRAGPTPSATSEPALSLSKGLPASHGVRIGFTVGRALGGAVQRNRMKRRLREAVRLSLSKAAIAADVVINPKRSLLKADFADIVNEVQRAFAKIEQELSQSREPAKIRANPSDGKAEAR
jgi:ribonuclease P protein component